MRKILASLVLAPSLAAASGYSLPNPHPRDLAVCASGVAAQTDAAAAFALPAALARISGPSIRLGGGAVTIGTDWTDPTPGATLPPYATFAPPTPGPAEPGTASLNTTFTGFPTIAMSYGGKLPGSDDRGWGIGFALQPFGGTIVDWPDDWAGRYRITKVDRQVFSGIIGAGVSILPQVRIGGGLIYYYTKETFTQHLWQEPFSPAPPGTAGAADAVGKLHLTGGAFSYDASIEIDPVQGLPLTIAVDYKHKATQDLTGDVSFSNLSPFLASPLAAGTLTGSKSAYQTLTIPNTLNVAAAYKPVKKLTVMATFTFDRWVVYDADTFVADNGVTLVVPRHYKNGQTYRAGAAYDVADMLTVRAGVQRDVSGLRREFYSPTLPDASSWGGSLGVTIRFAKDFSFDAAGFYANFDKVTATGVGREPGIYGPLPAGLQTGTTGSFRGTYNTSAWVTSATLNWQPRSL